jgi:hypothetical protein
MFSSRKLFLYEPQGFGIKKFLAYNILYNMSDKKIKIVFLSKEN